ncbi:MAG: hypothetical protein CMO06_16130 [Thalassospira sp.]|nr:hypothetical protein [Thalassospira sp.]
MTFNQTWPASTAASDAAGYVLIDPDVLFRMQGDATIAQTGLGANFAVVQTAGSTTIGRSKNACDADTVATTNTLPIRIVDFYDGPSSSVGDTYTDGIFRFNAGHQLTNTTGI